MTRYSYGIEHYDQGGRGRCWELWHSGVKHSPRCELDLDHEGDHKGNAMSWSKEPDVDVDTAAKFLQYYRRIPNSNHDIVLLDNGSVAMSLRALYAATVFIDVRSSDD